MWGLGVNDDENDKGFEDDTEGPGGRPREPDTVAEAAVAGQARQQPHWEEA